MKLDEVIELVRAERAKQDEKWGIQHHPPTMWLTILTEEVGEACQAALDTHFAGKPIQFYRDELIQIAAVAMAALEDDD